MPVEQFLLDIKNNNAIMRALGMPVNQIDAYIQQIQTLKSNQKDRVWKKLMLMDMDGQFFSIQNSVFKWNFSMGTVQSGRKEQIISRPRDIQYKDGLIWVASYYARIALFDLDFSFKGYFGKWGDDGYRYVYAIAVGDDRVYVCCPHFLVCLDRGTGQKLWQFGDTTSGNPQDGRLSNPYGVAILPNGNVIVASYTTNFISEHDRETGDLIKIHLEYISDGMAWNEEIYHPYKIKMIQRPDQVWELWIAYYSSSYIGIFEYDEQENQFHYKTVLGKTKGLNVGNLYITDCRVSSDYSRAYVVADGMSVLASVDIQSSNILGYVGRKMWEDYNGNPETAGAFGQILACELIEGNIVVVDYLNNRLQQFPVAFVESEPVTFQYEGDLSEFKRIDFCSDNRFDPETRTIRIYPQALLSNPLPSEIYVCGIV